MTGVRCSPEAVRRLAGELERLGAEWSERARALRGALDEARTRQWRDRQSEGFAARMLAALSATDRAAERLAELVFEVQHRLVRLDEYTDRGRSTSLDTDPPHRGQPLTSTRRPAPKRTGETVPSRHGGILELWSFAGVAAVDIDWGADDGFVAGFARAAHHGNTAETYRRWAEHAARVARKVRDRGWDSVHGGVETQVRDVFLGSEPVRVSRRASGRVVVHSGRHRVLAALLEGATIPVEVVPGD